VAETFGRLQFRRDGRPWLDFDRYGKVYSTRGTPFKGREQAEFVLGAIRSDVARGMPKQQAVDRWRPEASAVHRISRWLPVWLEHIRELERAGERSLSYVRELERWCAADGHTMAFWGARTFHEVDFPGLQAWASWLTSRGLSPKTRHNVMAALHSFLAWLRQMGQLLYLPVFPWPRLREHAPRLLSAEAQAHVLEAIPEERRGIFLALALLGARPSETVRLRAADYNPGDPGWITFPKTKNGQPKRLPVPEELAAWLEKHLPRDARLNAAPLFALPYCGRGWRPSGPWYKKALEREWRAACAAVGVSSKLYEGTKHSTATEMLRRGVQERTIQGLLGHRDLRSTRRYARLADEAIVEAIRPTRRRVKNPSKTPPLEFGT
jgi:integrase